MMYRNQFSGRWFLVLMLLNFFLS